MPDVSIDAFRDRTVTHIVSLGPRCATTYNLRRHYDFASAYPFDWWITPANGLLAFIRRMDVDWIYDPRNLELPDGKRSVRHAPTGILLHHEFPRDATHPDRPVLDDFRDRLDGPRERTQHLLDKFRGLNRSGNCVVFIREEGIGPELEAALAPHFLDCAWAVARIPSLPEDEHGWVCDPGKWDTLLASLRLRLDPVQHRPFAGMAAEHGDVGLTPVLPPPTVSEGELHRTRLRGSWLRFLKNRLGLGRST